MVTPLFLSLAVIIVIDTACSMKTVASHALSPRCCKHGARWVKLNKHPVCFSARGRKPGSFHSTTGGAVHKVKFVYRSGGVTCAKGHKKYTPFSCIPTTKGMMVVLTDATNYMIVPPPFTPNIQSAYSVPGNDQGSSTVLVLSTGLNSYTVNKGDTLKVWYTEDLHNHTTSDNAGTTCTDVYGLM